MPEQVFQKISDGIKSEFKLSFAGGAVDLKDSSSKVVRVNKIGKLLCLQLDRSKKDIFPLFEKSIPDLCKVADRVLKYPKEDTLFVFIVELKSTKTNGAIEQVGASFDLANYICSTSVRLLNYPTVNIQYRGLIRSHKKFKGTMKPRIEYTLDPSGLKYKHQQTGCSINLDCLAI